MKTEKMVTKARRHHRIHKEIRRRRKGGERYNYAAVQKETYGDRKKDRPRSDGLEE